MTTIWIVTVFLFMGIALFSAILLILVKNPIYSIFSLILSIISSVIVLLICHVEFLAYVFLIVYVGAISILFLFVVMMLNIKVSQNVLVDFSTWEFYILLFILPKFIFMSNIVIKSCLTNISYFRWEEQILSIEKPINLLERTPYCSTLVWDEGYATYIPILENNTPKVLFNNDIDIFSYWLYTHFSFVFILSGVILLVSMIGALLLTTNKNLIK